MKNFFLKTSSEKKQIFKEMRDSYTVWRENIFRMNKPFFAIHNDFQELFLRDISGPALKLYIFLGLNSKYQSGESWFSSKEIADFFNKDQRTITGWFKELEDLGLLFREQQGFKMKANSFLRPYGFTIDEITGHDSSSVDNVLTDISTSLELGREIKLGLLLNYSLREFTFVLITQHEQVFYCSCFFNFDENDIKIIKEKLKKYNVSVDNFDIDTPVTSSKNKELAVYNHVLKYIREEKM